MKKFLMFLKLKIQCGKNFLKILLPVLFQAPGIYHIYKILYQNRIRKVIADKKYQMPNSANIETYNVCNGGCVMCPYPAMKRPKVKMEMSLFKKIVDDLHNHGFVTLAPSFYNEPFLDPDIFERIRYIKEKGMRVKIFTNASLLDKDRVEKLLDCPPDVMVISMDAVNPETLKEIRTGLDLNTVRENVRNLIKRRGERGLKLPLVTTVFVLQDKNGHELEKYKKEWEGIADKIDVNIDNMLVKGIPKFMKYAFPCQKLFRMFIITSSGKVALCCNDYDCEYSLGDFTSQNFEEIFSGEKMRAFKKMHSDFKVNQIKICKECIYSHDIYSWKWWREI